MSSPIAAPTSNASSPWRGAELAANLITLGLAGAWLLLLARMASGAHYQTDECFHAYMAEWIAGHGTLPRVIPELYSGFYYYYPPLFHLLGAAWSALFGHDALRYLNVFVSALLVVVMWVGCRRLEVPAAGRWAIALCAGSAWASAYAVRLYVEQLTTLLAVTALLLILRVRQVQARWPVVGLGVVAGLALIAKNSAWAIEGLLLVLAVSYALRRQGNVARAYAVAAGIALVVASPMLVRNAVLYGSPLYPAFAPDLHPLLYQLNRSTFTPAPATFYRETLSQIGWATGAMAILAIVVSVLRRRGSLELGLIGFCILLIVAGPLQALLDARHMLPVIAGLALLGSIVVAREVAGMRGVPTVFSVVLLAAAVFAVSRMPNYRVRFDVKPWAMDAFRAVADHVPVGETVLSLYTYDTFYYARRPATWPTAWGQREHPVEMFLTSNCDSVMLGLAKYRLRYLLVTRAPMGERFDGANYPRPFVSCMQQLFAAGRLEVLWLSETMVLVRVKS